ncbi:MAG: phosphoenolpyruvate--protein phosphotransferase [Burkholderiales bacterium]
MSFTLHGIPVAGGIAIGHAHLVSHTSLEAAHYLVPQHQLADESSRFEAAVASVHAELETLRGEIPADAPKEFSAFLDVHQLILADTTLSKKPREIIEHEQCNAEWALKVQADALLAQFDAIEDSYLRERKADVIQVVERIMKALQGSPGYVPPTVSEDETLILVARDLSPADVIQFKQHRVASFLTDLGGTTSHTAIVARSLNIPSVVALHHARQLVRERDLLIVDGTQGVVIVDPDPGVLADYRLRQHQWELERSKLKRLRNTRAATLDGTTIELHANIELPDDVAAVRENGATGIGLFRTEFLFLNREQLPDEDEQFEAYRRVVREMDGAPVTIRTYDLGADKQLAGEVAAQPPNPALGLRAIRLSLAEPRMFLVQLRALLRASHYGKLKILIPMLMSTTEIQQSLAFIAQAKQSLEDQFIPYDRQVPIGGMIEIPAAALSPGSFLKHLDFLSIGTNDLIQYMLAIDRTDDQVAHLYDPLHPAILQVLAQIIKTCEKAGKPIALCGEMAGEVPLTRLLLGFGLRQFSMHPAHLLEVKQRVLQTNLKDVTAAVQRMLRSDDPDRLHAMLDKLNV